MSLRLTRPLALLRGAARAAPRATPSFRLQGRNVHSVGLRTRLSTPVRPIARAPSRTLVRSMRTPHARFSSSSTTAPPEAKSAYQRFKELTKTYGSYAVIMYLALSTVDYTLTFMVVHSVGVQRIEPYVAHVRRWYRELRHGVAGADALDAADAARIAADEAQARADDAIAGRKAGDQVKEHWWKNKALWAELVLAYGIHKTALLPVRAGLTVAWTPRVVEWLRVRGWIGTSGAKRAAKHGADRVRGGMRDAGQRVVSATRKP